MKVLSTSIVLGLMTVALGKEERALRASELSDCGGCSSGYACDATTGNCAPVTCDAPDACSPVESCFPRFQTTCDDDQAICEEFVCLNQCIFTLCGADYQCVPSANGPECLPSNCNVADVCGEQTCVPLDNQDDCDDDYYCPLFECVDAPEECSEEDIVCGDPYNYACNTTAGLCQPIDCGAPEACEPDETCISQDRICFNGETPCRQYECN